MYLGPEPYPLAILPGSNIPLTALDASTQSIITGALQKAQNLADAASAAQCAINIGALQKANNLSELTNKAAACANLGAVQKAGDTMSGLLTMLSSSSGQAARIQFNYNNGAYTPGLQVAGSTIGFTNAANSAYTWQVDNAGNASSNSCTVTGLDAHSAALRILQPSVAYGTFFMSDPNNFYIMLTASGDQYGSYTAMRPFNISFVNGAIGLDGTGSGGVNCGGALTVNGIVTMRSNANVTGNLGVSGTASVTGGTMMASSSAINIGASQGAYCAWNEGSGSGMTSFINNQGGGGGGFIWRNINQNNTAETMRMTLDGAGNLTVPNTIQTSQWISATGGQSKTVTNFGYLNQGGAGQSPGQNTTSVSIYANQAMMANQFWAFSDRRIKHDIEPISTKYALEFVRRVTPVEFYKEDQPGLIRGFLAQDVGRMSAGGREMLNASERKGLKGEVDADGYQSPEGFVLSIEYDQIIAVQAVVLRNLLDRVDHLEAELRRRA